MESADIPAHDEDAGVRRNFIALAFVAIIVIVGLWLTTSFREHNRTLECISRGHHDCVPFDPKKG